MIILKDGTAIILKWVTTYSPSVSGLKVSLVDGSYFTISDEVERESFINAMKKLYNELPITDLSK